MHIAGNEGTSLYFTVATIIFSSLYIHFLKTKKKAEYMNHAIEKSKQQQKDATLLKKDNGVN